MKFAQLFLLVFSFFIFKPANAGLLIEPVLGYNFAKLEGDVDEKAIGPSFGGRLGYQNLGFQLGLDFLKSTLDVDNDDFKENLNSTEYAAFVGFEFPILLRVYAGYIFAGAADTKFRTDLGSGNQDYTLKYDGITGTKFGVGFTGLPFVDINFEYRKGTFKDGKLGSAEMEDSDYSAYMIGVSLPFVL